MIYDTIITKNTSKAYYEGDIMKRRMITAIIAIAVCVAPTFAFADDDICYHNPTGYDDWGNPTGYGSHSWYLDYTEDPRCENEGYDCYTCNYCYHEKYVTLPATGHDWSDTNFVDSPDRFDTQIWGQKCENEDCEAVRYTPKTIKKGKKKRLWTKSQMKAVRKLARKYSKRSIRFTSSKKNIATVDNNGVIKAKKKGTTYVTAKIYLKQYGIWMRLKYKIIVK